MSLACFRVTGVTSNITLHIKIRYLNAKTTS